jgi:hypothetical protein
MMTTIKIIGWREDFRKISFTKILMDYAEFSLSEAKHTTDKILDNTEVRFLIESNRVSEFVKKAEEIGAVLEIES